MWVILRETLLKKGSSDGGASPLSLRDISPHCGESPSNSLPKTFSIKFSPCRALPGYYRISHFVKSALHGLNSVIKSLEKGFGERTFPQKGFSPIITHKLLYKHHGKESFFISCLSAFHRSRRIFLQYPLHRKNPRERRLPP